MLDAVTSSPSLFRACWIVFKREWWIQLRQPTEWLNPLGFFLIVVALFPLGVSPEHVILRMIAPGVVWVGGLLAILLAVESLFRQDYDDGSLEQFLIAPHPLFLLLSAKLLVHTLLISIPIILLTPLWSALLFLDTLSTQVLLMTLLLGLPTIILMSALGAALTVGLRRGGVLIALMILPLNIPVLIFATGAVQAALQGVPVAGYLAILAALLLLTVTFVPWVIAMALRVMVSQ